MKTPSKEEIYSKEEIKQDYGTRIYNKLVGYEINKRICDIEIQKDESYYLAI